VNNKLFVAKIGEMKRGLLKIRKKFIDNSYRFLLSKYVAV
jgi:hypothetical protein